MQNDKRPVRVPWPTLSILSAVYLLIEYQLRAAGFAALSGDDFVKYLISKAWALEPFFMMPEGILEVSWLPLFFWASGTLFFTLGPHWNLVLILNQVLMIATLIGVFFCGQLLSGSVGGGLWATALTAFLSWTLWTGNSFTEYPLFLSLLVWALVFLLFWLRSRRLLFLWLASGLLLFATMVRYEGWFVSAAFALVLARRLSAWPAPRGVVAAAALLANLFIGPVVGWNLLTRGRLLPFFGVYLQHHSLAEEMSVTPSLGFAVGQIPWLLLLVAPVLIPWSPWLFWRALRCRHEAVKCYAALVGLTFLFLVLTSLGGFVPHAALQRYVLWLAFLVIPLFPLLLHWRFRTFWILIFFASCATGVFFAFVNNRTQHHGMRAAAEFIAGLAEIKTVASEAVVRARLGIPVRRRDFYFQLLDQHTVMQSFLSAHQLLPVSAIRNAQFATLRKEIVLAPPAEREFLSVSPLPDALVLWSSELLPKITAEYDQIANCYNYKILVRKGSGLERRLYCPSQWRLQPIPKGSLLRAVSYDHRDLNPYLVLQLRRSPVSPLAVSMEGARRAYRIPVLSFPDRNLIYTQEIPSWLEAEQGTYRFYLVEGQERHFLCERFYYTNRRSAVGKLLTSGGDFLDWGEVLVGLL